MKNYVRLFDESPAPMYIYDERTYEFLAVNDAALHQYGYGREEFLSMKAFQIRPPQDVELFTKANLDVPDSYFDFGTWRHCRKNGELFHVHIYAHRTVFKGRGARSVLAVDIDSRVRTERAIAEKSAEIIDILESITDGFYALNRNWEITYFNKAAEKVLGRRREEVIGKSLWESFPRSREGKFYAEYERAMTTKESAHFEEEYAPLGVWASINVYPTKDGIAVYFMDITEQKKIRQKIANDERNLRAIINNTTDIIWSIDRQNNIISANDAFWDRVSSLTGKTGGTLTEQDFDKDRSSRWKQYFARAFQGEAYKIVVDDVYQGKEIFEEVSFNPIRDIHDEIIGISCFSRDITTQHLYLKQIEKQNAKFREIAWSQSHEVRAPLSNIMGLTALLNHDDASDSGNAEVIRLIGEASRQLEEIVKKISAKASQEGWEQ
ncbi:PAS domain S-box protein [Flavobacterium agri]|nr:PAS domain S-box protein [Flavobacterium agri]